MKITKAKIKHLKPCRKGWEWYLKNQETDLKKLLLKLDEHNPSWARWLYTNLMNKKQNVAIAIFSAELVIDIYEKKYPNDNRPQKAIEAAKQYLKRPCKETADATNAAAAYAACAVDATVDVAYAVDAAGKKEIQKKIILEAIKVLEGLNGKCFARYKLKRTCRDKKWKQQGRKGE